MKLLLPLALLVAISGEAFAQTAPTPANATPPAQSAPPVPTTPIFRDVPPTHWAFAAVQRLAAAGIIQGYPSNATPTTQTVAKVAPTKPAPSPRQRPTSSQKAQRPLAP